MLKHAYNLGYKIALAEAGMVDTEEPEELQEDAQDQAEQAQGGAENVSAADQLAELFQQIPNPDENPEKNRKLRDPGNSDEVDSWGVRSGAFGFDNLSSLGLDIRGPESTSV